MNHKSVLSSESAAPVFAALGDNTRLQLVMRLNDGQPRSISVLTQGLRLSRQGVTKHLRVLQQAGLVKSRSVGRENRYTLDVTTFNEMQSYLESISSQWDQALLRLKQLVENDS